MREVRRTLVSCGAAAAAAVGATALHALEPDPLYPAVAAVVAALLVALVGGSAAGGITGLFCGTALVVLRGGGVEDLLEPAAAVPLVGLFTLGWFAGRRVDLFRRRIEEGVERELELRRRLYRMKKERRRPATASAPAPAALPAPAPAPPTALAGCSDVPCARDPACDHLSAAVHDLAAALNEPRILEAVLRSVCRVLGAGRAVFHPHDRKTDLFLAGVSHPPAPEPVPVGDTEPLLRMALRERRLLDRAQDAAVFADAGRDVDLLAPVFDRMILAGLLVVESIPAAAPFRRDRVTILSTAAGLALSATRLVERCAQQEKKDPLTGLIGVGAIREVLGGRLERGPTAVLLVSADRIREVNESYGRKAGDQVVAALARLVSLETGAEGAVGRYGGATLLVVLPGRRADAAGLLGERLLRRVPASLTAGPEGLAGPLTLSIGVAAASVGPVDALLQEAERALADAQEAGGNRLVAADLRRAGTVNHA